MRARRPQSRAGSPSFSRPSGPLPRALNWPVRCWRQWGSPRSGCAGMLSRIDPLGALVYARPSGAGSSSSAKTPLRSWEPDRRFGALASGFLAGCRIAHRSSAGHWPSRLALPSSPIGRQRWATHTSRAATVLVSRTIRCLDSSRGASIRHQLAPRAAQLRRSGTTGKSGVPRTACSAPCRFDGWLVSDGPAPDAGRAKLGAAANDLRMLQDFGDFRGFWA